MRRRPIVIPLHLNRQELRHLDEQCHRAGLSREEFLRSLVAGIELHPRPCTHHAELLRQVSGLCNNANQLAREVWKEVKEQW